MNLFLILLLNIMGYCILLGIVIGRADNKRAISFLAVTVLVIYLCFIGLLSVLEKYLGEAGLILFATAIIFSCFYLFWLISCLVREKPQFNKGELVTFISYILAVFYVTIFFRTEGTDARIQMEVLNGLRGSAQEDFWHFFLNIIMFIPVGILAPLVTNRAGSIFFSGMFSGLLLSTIIETGQLIFQKGTCDIDDILANTLGAGVGSVLIVAWRKKG